MYQVIYADPPWAYNDKTPRGGAENHYETMSLPDICAFQVNGKPVKELVAPDAALFLWVTWPLMPHAIAVMGSWGFTYKTCAFTWVKTTQTGKPAFGLGHWTRGNTEPCLLAVRGKPKRIDAGVPQVLLEELEEEAVFAQRARHSAKPPEIRERIVRLMGDVPRLELFARDRANGWDSIGNELK